MADILTKTHVTNPALTDALYIVTDPAGTPADGYTLASELGTTIRTAGVIYAGRAIKQIDNTASETSLAPSTATGSLTLPADYLVQGKTIHVRVSGWIDSTGSPTLTFKFKVGADTFLNSGAVTVGANFNDVYYTLEVDWTIWTTGATATHAMQGRIFIGSTVVPFGATGFNTINTTGTLLLATTAQWSAADPSNVLNVSNYTVESAN